MKDKAVNAVMQAAGMEGATRGKLTALLQSQDDDDDEETGAPAAANYKSSSGGIVDVLNSMKEKAEGELADLRKAEGEARQNFNMLKGSLEGKIGADTKDKDEETSAIAEATQAKSEAEGDLSMTTKDLAAANNNLATVHGDCLTVAADHEATVTARAEELKVIATAKKILEESTAGAVSQSYSLLQIKNSADLKNNEVVAAVKKLAKEHKSVKLAQLASKIGTVITYGGQGVFDKVTGLINDMIAKLEKEAEDDATEKAYCDEELAKTEAKKSELDDDIAALTAKIDQASSQSAQLKEEVAEAQESLAAISKEQVEMDDMRREQNADYKQAKADLEAGIAGVEKALTVLRDYYGGASSAAMIQQDDWSMMQQPAKPAAHSKSSGAGGGIIDILEICESDFSKDLAGEEAAESDAQESYDKQTQENKIQKTMKEQDVKYKTQEFKGLDTEITELSSDKGTASKELAAVMEYYGKIKDRCIAKPETYEERTARRKAEIDGLKQAQQILDEQTAFSQIRKRRGLKVAKLGF